MVALDDGWHEFHPPPLEDWALQNDFGIRAYSDCEEFRWWAFATAGRVVGLEPVRKSGTPPEHFGKRLESVWSADFETTWMKRAESCWGKTALELLSKPNVWDGEIELY